MTKTFFCIFHIVGDMEMHVVEGMEMHELRLMHSLRLMHPF